MRPVSLSSSAINSTAKQSPGSILHFPRLCLPEGHSLREFDVAAERVGELHLARGLAFGFEEAGICDENARASCPRRRHIQPIEAVEELHPVRCVFGC